MNLDSDLINFATRRLKLCRMERHRFKISPQIPLEIFLLLGANSGTVALSEIYNEIPATEKAIRLHLHNLVSSGFMIEETSVDDKRSKHVVLTQRGLEELADYYESYKQFRAREMTE